VNAAGRRPSSDGQSAGWGGFPPPTKPRPVQGGVVARSARGEIGEHWWSRRFVEVLESFALGSRLTRGKNYARRGQVISLEVAPGLVTARVQGSRRTPYKVLVGLAPFPELVWAKVEVTLAEQAVHSARLLAGELPAELEDLFAAAGAPLFPQRASDLQMSCSCPDFEVPCKHLAATFYLLAELFDDDPFRILHWRGRARHVLLARLRKLRDSSPGLPDDGIGVDRPTRGEVGAQLAVGAAAALSDEALAGARLSSGTAGFWDAGELPPLPTPPDLPADLLLRQLPEPGAELGGHHLTSMLRATYQRLAESPSPEPSGS
jgi:uncharacterized Zn finger protein